MLKRSTVRDAMSAAGGIDAEEDEHKFGLVQKEAYTSSRQRGILAAHKFHQRVHKGHGCERCEEVLRVYRKERRGAQRHEAVEKVCTRIPDANFN